MLYHKHMLFMAQEPAGTPNPAGDGTPPESGEGSGSAGKSGSAGGATQAPAPEGINPATGKMFTQAEVDRIVTERLQRATSKFADYDDIKKQLKAVQDASKTDLQKLQDDLADLNNKMLKAEAEAKASLIRSTVVAEAAKLEFNDPADAYRMLDVAALTISEDGQVVGLQAALTKLVADKPYLRRSNMPKINPTNPSGAALTMAAIKKMSEAEINERWTEVQAVLAAGA